MWGGLQGRDIVSKIQVVAALALLAAPPLPAVQQSPLDMARDLLGRLEREEFSSAAGLFDDALRNVLPPEKLSEVWKGLVETQGPFKAQGAARMETGEGVQTVVVPCEFANGVVDARIVLSHGRSVAGLSFVPGALAAPGCTPLPMPALFREKEVTVGEGQWALPGTLTLPAAEGPCCAVVLVHGSGPQDRDESIGLNRPFRDIAWGLAARGVAVLRYEKRTRQHLREVERMKERLTVDEETVEDALAAVKLLRVTEGIDPKKIYILGHCLGGMLAPRIAARDGRIAGLIILAGASRPLEDVLVSQMEYLLSPKGAAPSAIGSAELERLKAQAAKVKDASLSEKTPSSELPRGFPACYWLSLRGYDPAAEAKKLGCPILVLQGGRDYHVTAGDFDGWKRGLEGRKNAQFEWCPDLNHLFVSGEGMSNTEEYHERYRQIEGRVLDRIAAWVRENSGGAQRPTPR